LRLAKQEPIYYIEPVVSCRLKVFNGSQNVKFWQVSGVTTTPKRLFVALRGLRRAHADNLARIGSGALLPRAAVNTPDVGCVVLHASP
jgi:hypothetical protein